MQFCLEKTEVRNYGLVVDFRGSEQIRQDDPYTRFRQLWRSYLKYRMEKKHDGNDGNNGSNGIENGENRKSGLWFAVLDLKWGYFQVELAEECRNLTTILSFDGKYRFKRMPMGLNASGDVFNIRTDALISGIPEAQKIVDDISIDW